MIHVSPNEAVYPAHNNRNVEEQHYERGELFWQFILSAGKSVLSTHPGMYVDMLELHFIMSAASLQTHTCLDDAQELYEQQKGDKADADAQIPAAFHDMFARGLVLNNRFDEAMLHCQLSREKTEKTEAYKAGEVWPEMAVLTQAWCLVGLDRESEAEDMLVDMLAWRESKYGKDDIEDTKSVLRSQSLSGIDDLRAVEPEPSTRF